MAALGAAAPAVADKNFAHSKSLDMSFIALGEPWCKPDVDILVRAGDATKFGTTAYTEIIRKLGHVLMRECPQATALSITGRASEKTVWTGSAAKSDNWAAVEQKTPVTAATAAPAPVAATGHESRPARTETAESAAEAAPSADGPVTAVTKTLVSEKVAAEKPGPPESVRGASARQTEAMETAKSTVTTVPPTAAKSEAVTSKPAAQAVAEPASASPPGVTFPDCFSMFQWGAEAYAADSGIRGNQYYGGRYQGKYLLTGLRDDSLVPVYGATIDKWNEDDLKQWVSEFKRCDKELKAVVRGMKNRYQDPTYLAYANGQRYFIMLGMRRGRNDEAAFSQLIEHQIEVRTEYRKALELQQAQLQQAEDLPATADSINAVNRMVADPQLLYLPATDRQAHQALLNKRAMALKKEIQLAQQRAKLLAQLQQQYQQLAEASRYDRVRFYMTLMFDKPRIDQYRIQTQNLRYRNRGPSPFSGAWQITHPAQFFDRLQGDTAKLGGAMHMLVYADDGQIEKPYSMVVLSNGADAEIDGWMLLKTAPEFHVAFNESGKPVFEFNVDEAVACKTDRCLEEMSAEEMMRIWYEDDKLDFSLATASGDGQ